MAAAAALSAATSPAAGSGTGAAPGGGAVRGGSTIVATMARLLPLSDGDGDVVKLATSDDAHGRRLANALGTELGHELLGAVDLLAAQDHDHVANQQATLLRRPARFNTYKE
jgi:hypothetical protein